MFELVRGNLFSGMGWVYLRYVHLWDFVLKHSATVGSLVSVGSGGGFAEFLVGLEFPELEVYITDIVAEGRPNYHRVMGHMLANDIRKCALGSGTPRPAARVNLTLSPRRKC